MDEKEFLQRKIFLKWQSIELLLRDIWELENQLDELEKKGGKPGEDLSLNSEDCRERN